MNLSQIAWVLKYAPKKIEEMLLSEENREFFSSLTDIPNNLLFIGTPGAGKTTLAKILARKFAPSSYIYINASDEGGIDTVRTKIKDFVETVSFDGTQKIIILDEADGTSTAFQQALRSVMEEYLNDVKFILTGNFRNKIMDAIQSRCVSFDFSLDIKDVFKRIKEIIDNENIQYTKENLKEIAILTKSLFPDIRKTINEIQKRCLGGIYREVIQISNPIAENIYQMIKDKNPVWDIREFVIKNENDFNNDYHYLMKQLFNLFVIDKNITAVLHLTEGMYRHNIVLDKEINFMNVLLNLCK